RTQSFENIVEDIPFEIVERIAQSDDRLDIAAHAQNAIEKHCVAVKRAIRHSEQIEKRTGDCGVMFRPFAALVRAQMRAPGMGNDGQDKGQVRWIDEKTFAAVRPETSEQLRPGTGDMRGDTIQ